MTCSLSTHVLDTAAGKPATRVQVELRLGEDVVRGGALVRADEADIARAQRVQARRFAL